MGLTIRKYDHAPTHWLIDDSYYFITGAIFEKKRLLRSSVAKELFIKYLFQYIEKYKWELHEWVILENHYHFLAKVFRSAEMPRFINTLHKTSAYHIKKRLISE